MKKQSLILYLFLALVFTVVHGQQRIVDSLKRELYTTRNDTLRLVLYKRLDDAYEKVNYDSALHYAQHYLKASQQLGFKLNEADALVQTASAYSGLGNAAYGLELLQTAQGILQMPQKPSKLLPAYYLALLPIPQKLFPPAIYQQYITGRLNIITALGYFFNGNESKGVHYFRRASETATSIQSPELLSIVYFAIGAAHAYSNPDSALYYLERGYKYALQVNYMPSLGNIYDYTAKAYHVKGDHVKELHFKRMALQYGLQEQDLIFTGWSYIAMAGYHQEMNDTDSALCYAHRALQIAQKAQDHSMEYWSSTTLMEIYKALNKKDSAFDYSEQMAAAKEKISSEQSIRQYEAVAFNQQLQQQAIETAKAQYRNKVRTYALLLGLFIFLVAAVVLWRNNHQKHKANIRLQQQKSKTEQALQQLKATQAQLIQSEKMASLGELTAGIAHEIQNPLNFVNNFSETNKELLEEAETEFKAGNRAEGFLLLTDIRENEEKVNLHGRRADAIVKNMLEHSRSAKGEKQLTDINSLVDEYLRLSYHGFRAKDKNFNATIQTNFDTSSGKISIIPQEIGRVLLNVFNNAFYAVGEKTRLGNEGYEPAVTVNTRKIDNKVELVVQDNGMGIPQQVLDKIFQPFFTTKPTGEGTGLGLSLSYDIVKAHGGELKVISTEGEGSEFIIQLPVNYTETLQ